MREKGVKNKDGETLKSGGLILNQGKILLVSANNKIFGIPKGHLEGSETLEQGGIREILEETGYEVEIIRKLSAIKYQYEGTGEKVFLQYYLYKIKDGNLCPEPETFLRWFSLEDALKVVPYANERAVIKEAYD